MQSQNLRHCPWFGWHVLVSISRDQERRRRLRVQDGHIRTVQIVRAVPCSTDYSVLSRKPNTIFTLGPRNQTQRGCVLKEEPACEIINVKTGQPFTFSDPCVELGPHIAYDAAATDAGVAGVNTFLRSAFKLN